MAKFAAAWLALREPADRRSRSVRLSRSIADTLPRDRPIHVLDLAAGTGSNARFLTPYLHSAQKWLLVDHDAALLNGPHAVLPAGAVRRVMDLSDAQHLTQVLAGRDLVTGSALLDLVSEEWLQILTAACRDHGTAVLFALSYDGRIVCSPPEPEDGRVCDLVNQHQRTDKGFGPALGPAAAACAARQLEAVGYEVWREPSDWVLGPDEDELQRQLIEGWADAAVAVAPMNADVIATWRTQRLAHVAEGRSRLVVGHEDVGAFIA
jgi:hypothetical protein